MPDRTVSDLFVRRVESALARSRSLAGDIARVAGWLAAAEARVADTFAARVGHEPARINTLRTTAHSARQYAERERQEQQRWLRIHENRGSDVNRTSATGFGDNADRNDLPSQLRQRHAQILLRIEQLQERHAALVSHRTPQGSSPEQVTAAQMHAEHAHNYARRAHEQAAARHDEAADMHERANRVIAARSQREKARTHRETAEQDRTAAAAQPLDPV